jgi:large conductance mechanosensitive channel
VTYPRDERNGRDDEWQPVERFERIVRAGGDRLKLSGFRKFILRGNVVDLAVGIVIGAAFTAVVQSLVKDFITPLVSIPLPNAQELAKRHWTVGGAQFFWGDFLNNLVSLVLVGLVVYYVVVLPVNSLMERFKPETDPSVETKSCPECKSKIPHDATRCAFCTVEVPVEPVEEPTARAEAPRG